METTNVNGFTKDNDMDVLSLLHSSAAKKEEVFEEKAPVEEKKEASPLEQMMKEKEKNTGGVVVDTEELEAGKERTSFENPVYNDKFKDGVADEMSELDDLTEKAKLIYMKIKPSNGAEQRELMSELDVVVVKDGIAIVPPNAKYIVAKQVKTQTAEGEKVIDTVATSDDEVLEETSAEDILKDKARIDRREEIINLIIDKTGMGGNITFTPEEQEKISKATEIRVKEVENLDLKSKKIRKASKSFVDIVKEQKLVRSGSVRMSFPASGFSADMQGLTYGELADISLNPDDPLEYNKVYKKLSIIYNKMKNPSCGDFENFNDFLSKFSYTDIDLAVYALMIATYPESNVIPLKCGNRNCGKDFEHRYATRSLLKLDACSDKFLEKVKQITTQGRFGAKDMALDSAVQNVKMIELPESGYIVEIAIASADEYLNKIINLDNEDFFKQEFPDDYNNVMAVASVLLVAVRSVSVPDVDGGYIQFDEFKDVLRAIYTISPEEISILSSIVAKMIETYSVTFAFKDVVCPYCKTQTKELAVDVNELVFRTYQLQMSTQINVENILGL